MEKVKDSVCGMEIDKEKSASSFDWDKERPIISVRRAAGIILPRIQGVTSNDGWKYKIKVKKPLTKAVGGFFWGVLDPPRLYTSEVP